MCSKHTEGKKTHGSFPRLIRPYSLYLHHSTSVRRCSCRQCSGTPCPNTYACLQHNKRRRIFIISLQGCFGVLMCLWVLVPYHTVHHCCPHNRCHRHSATGCGCSIHSGSETHLPHTLWELQKKQNGFNGCR